MLFRSSNQEMLNTKYLNETQEERVAKLVSEIALLQKEGAVQDSIVDVNYNTARKIQKEIENFYYEMVTRRMSAEAAKEQAAAMVDKIAKDYELGKGHLDNENQKNLREWIYGGNDQLSEIIGSVSKFKQEERYRDWETDRKSTRLNSSHITRSRMPSSA